LRYWHTATLLPNGLVLVTGGNNGSDALANSELYDPAAGTWTNTGSLATARANHTATLLPNGLVLVTGGLVSDYLNSAELYNPAAGTWTNTSSLTTARGYHAATLLPNGLVLVTGGINNSNGYLASAELYNPAVGTWTKTGSLTFARYGQTATLLPEGLVLATGGYGISSDLASDFLDSAELYDIGVGFIATATSPPILSGQLLLPNGSFQLGFTNGSGLAFTILSATNLSPAPINWTVLGTPTEISSGNYQFTDQQATNFPRRFYRVSSP
jgi:hypothetical protein